MNNSQALLRPSGMNLGRKPSGHNVQGNQDYGQANFNQKQKQFGLPGLDSQSRMGSQSRMRQASRMKVGRTTPRHSSMNINNPNDAKQTRNTGNAFYLTQGEVTNQAPKTGASAFRSGKMAPLLTPAHQRMMQLNQSQALSPGRNNGPMVTQLDQLDIERERNKISRFLNTKERSGQVLAARETRIEARLREMEKKQTLFEKRKKLENKHQMEKLKEK